MLKMKSVTGNLPKSLELSQRLNNKTLVLSSQQTNWNGILVEQYQNPLTPSENELPALSDHWLILPLGNSGRVTHKRND